MVGIKNGYRNNGNGSEEWNKTPIKENGDKWDNALFSGKERVSTPAPLKWSRNHSLKFHVLSLLSRLSLFLRFIFPYISHFPCFFPTLTIIRTFVKVKFVQKKSTSLNAVIDDVGQCTLGERVHARANHA